MAQGRLSFVMPARSADALVFERDDGRCELVYTYAIRLRPLWPGRLLDPLASLLFAWETRRRFAAMARYLRRTAG